MFHTSTTLEKPSRNYQVKFHSLSQIQSNALLMRVNYFLLKDRQWRSYPEDAAQSKSWDSHVGLRLQRLKHMTIQRGYFYNQVIMHLCYSCKQADWFPRAENGWGQKLQRSLNLQKRAGLGRNHLYLKLCFQTSFAFYSMSLLWEEVALLWKEWELPSNLWDHTIKTFGANLHGGSGESWIICRQLHAEENIWGGKSDLEQLIGETFKIRRVSPAWNYKHAEFLILYNDLNTKVLAINKSKKTLQTKKLPSYTPTWERLFFPISVSKYLSE